MRPTTLVIETVPIPPEVAEFPDIVQAPNQPDEDAPAEVESIPEAPEGPLVTPDIELPTTQHEEDALGAIDSTPRAPSTASPSSVPGAEMANPLRTTISPGDQVEVLASPSVGSGGGAPPPTNPGSGGSPPPSPSPKIVPNYYFTDILNIIRLFINNRFLGYQEVLSQPVIAAGENDGSITRGVWISGLYGFIKQGLIENAPGYTAHNRGGNIGFDVEINNNLIGVA